jgi:hypothetical protein
LNLFPQWSFEEFYVADKNLLSIERTQNSRKFFRRDRRLAQTRSRNGSEKYLDVFRQTEFFPHLQKEYEYLRQYKADTRFVGVNFAPTFLTTDAVVVQSGHVLVVRRGHHPGKGLLALPGGFLKESGARRQRDSGIKRRNADQNSGAGFARQHQKFARFRLPATLAARSNRYIRLFHRTRTELEGRFTARKRRRRRGKSLLAAAFRARRKRRRVF